MEPHSLIGKFFEYYSDRASDPVLFFSPGRVNLIGEHTDYNNGFVLPCALNLGTYLAARRNNDGIIRLRSLNFPFTADVNSASFKKNSAGEWINYPLGLFDQFAGRGFDIQGVDLLYSGDIPNGAGLSSSASIEMVTAAALNYFTGSRLSTLDLVKMSQAAENGYVGMNCGIMDQFAVGFGEEDKAIFLNCGTLRYDLVPVNLGDYSIIIVNTNKRRALTDSKYNERRSECEEALRLLRKVTEIGSLSELGPGDLPLLESAIDEPTIRRRAKHIITENSRVLESVKALHTGDLTGFGKLMRQSHQSLSNDYEVTGNELDTLAFEAAKTDGVIGSRMTGGGFGGCTINIVDKACTENFITTLTGAYSSKTGLEPSFYFPTIGAGTRMLS